MAITFKGIAFGPGNLDRKPFCWGGSLNVRIIHRIQTVQGRTRCMENSSNFTRALPVVSERFFIVLRNLLTEYILLRACEWMQYSLRVSKIKIWTSIRLSDYWLGMNLFGVGWEEENISLRKGEVVSRNWSNWSNFGGKRVSFLFMLNSVWLGTQLNNFNIIPSPG